MEKKKFFFRVACLIFFLIALCGMVISAGAALQIGKTYDQSNYQEIEDLLPHGLHLFVKNGDFILHTGKLEFENKREPAYLARSQENDGKFDVTPAGDLIHKGTGESVEWYYGYPFPNIDPKDPKVCAKIMHNFVSVRCFFTGTGPAMNRVRFVGDGGVEREVLSYLTAIYYVNRVDGRVPNPRGFLQQSIVPIHTPYDLRGVISMSWVYIDDREDSAFSYVPMLRRVRRTSAAARSDPFLGSDSGVDDAYGYFGKVAAMDYKFLGEKTIIIPMMDTKYYVMPRQPDGSVFRKFWDDKKLAAEVPGSKQAPYAWIGLVWIPTQCYLLEANAKDPYYNYGKQIFYVSKEVFVMPYKEVYDHSGEYWKTNFVIEGVWGIDDGVRIRGNADISYMVDPRARHSTPTINIPLKGYECRYNIPFKELNEGNFTTGEMIRLSK